MVPSTKSRNFPRQGLFTFCALQDSVDIFLPTVELAPDLTNIFLQTAHSSTNIFPCNSARQSLSTPENKKIM